MEETANKPGIPIGMFIGIAVLVAIVSAAGVYAYVNNKAEKEKKDLSAQITELQSQISKAVTTTPSDSTSVSVTTDETANWKTYTSSIYGFRFKYPNDWTVKKSDTGVDLTQDVNTKEGLSYYSMGVTIQKYSGTVNDYINDQNAQAKKTISEGGPDLTLPSGETVSLNGVDWTKLTNSPNGPAGKVDKFLITKDGYFYMVTYETGASEGPVYDLTSYIEIAKNIVSTFQFIK